MFVGHAVRTLKHRREDKRLAEGDQSDFILRSTTCYALHVCLLQSHVCVARSRGPSNAEAITPQVITHQVNRRAAAHGLLKLDEDQRPRMNSSRDGRATVKTSTGSARTARSSSSSRSRYQRDSFVRDQGRETVLHDWCRR